MKFHGNLTMEEFWFEWFGLLGREIGSKPPYPTHRQYTDNPNDLMDLIRFCEENTIPVWQSAQPFASRKVPMGIEKIFLDFDDDNKYCPDCDEWYNNKDTKHVDRRSKKDSTLVCVKHHCKVIIKPRKDVIAQSVTRFLRDCIPQGVHPMVVETHKGYHVYVFLKSIRPFTKSSLRFAKAVYATLVRKILLKGQEIEFLDSSCEQDISRMARVPLTIHEATGKRCKIVKMVRDEKQVMINDRLEISLTYKLVEDQIRDVEYFRSNGLLDSTYDEAVLMVRRQQKEKAEQTKQTLDAAEKDLLTKTSNGHVYDKINRPCFQVRADIGEMSHAIRLAYLIEAYFHGANTEDQLVDLFRDFSDFDESLTRYYVKYFLDHEPDVYPPYKCSTLIEKGYCVEGKCPKWRRDKGKA